MGWNATMRPNPVFFGGALLVVACVAACGGSAASISPPTPGTGPSQATFPLGSVAGNSVTAPLPTDAPVAVVSLSPLPSCGAEMLFEADPDISPLPTPPWATTDAESNQAAQNCLVSAWENGSSAQLETSEISDEQDEIYTIYRLPGDGTVDVIHRVRSHTDQATTWTRTTCRELSLQEDAVTPANCDQATPLS